MWGAKKPASPLALTDRGRIAPASRRSAGGAGVSTSAMGHCGDIQAKDPIDCGEPLFAAAIAGAAAPISAAAAWQCGSSLLDIGESMVWWLASSAPHREAGDGLEVAPTGLEGLLDVAVTSPSEAWSPPASAGASGPHPAHGRGKLAMGSKANPSRVGEIGVQGVRQNRRQIYAGTSQPRAIPGLEKIPKAARTEYLGLRFLLRSHNSIPDALCLLRDPACQ